MSWKDLKLHSQGGKGIEPESASLGKKMDTWGHPFQVPLRRGSPDQNEESKILWEVAHMKRAEAWPGPGRQLHMGTQEGLRSSGGVWFAVPLLLPVTLTKRPGSPSGTVILQDARATATLVSLAKH